MGLLFGCVSFEEPPPQPSRWAGDVEAIVGSCRDCHDAALPPQLDYGSLMGCSIEGEPWIRAGDPDSLLVEALSQPGHAADPVATEKLERWIAEGAVFFSTRAHPAGFSVPSSEDFHGASYAIERCAECHQRPVELGGAPPCTTCHARAFEDERCDACHGADGDPRPRANPCDTPAELAAVGAHAFHVEPARSDAYPAIACATCHQVPESFESAGHFADGTPRAEVRFQPETIATWDPAARTCSGVACHSGRTIAWTDTASTSECGRCHGSPPPDHASDRCQVCHANARHLDGVLDVGTGCRDCHSVEDSGAHARHLADGSFAAAASCEDCHREPRDRDDPGHLDSDLPAEVLFSTVRATGGGRATPSWDGQRCAGVGCHGGHLDGGARVSIEWSGEGIECGDCHGLPPVFVRGEALHLPTGEGECGACHRTGAGEPITEDLGITEAGRAVHANGCVELEAGCVR